MNFSPMIDELVESLRCLPGVGQKTAQRMAFHLLERNREGGESLAGSLMKAMAGVGYCRGCRNFTEAEYCSICASEKRNRELLCVVESPADVAALESAGSFRGTYFVLMGHLSPIDGIGPEEIGITQLLERVSEIGVSELILATNPTVEGEATAYYISEHVQRLGVKVSRIAHGVPLGGELEYVDSGTLAHALDGRRPV